MAGEYPGTLSKRDCYTPHDAKPMHTASHLPRRIRTRPGRRGLRPDHPLASKTSPVAASIARGAIRPRTLALAARRRREMVGGTHLMPQRMRYGFLHGSAHPGGDSDRLLLALLTRQIRKGSAARTPPHSSDFGCSNSAGSICRSSASFHIASIVTLSLHRSI